MSPPARDIADDDDRLTPAERVLRRRTDALSGRALSSTARQAQRTIEGYLTGGNPPRWMERVGEIDAGIARVRRELAAEHRALRHSCGDDADEFARRWREHVHSRDFHELNALIRQHNEWYPVERNLPVDPRTGEYVATHGRSHLRPLLGPGWALEQFPAS
ncbi:hypothetical protein [Conexibacter sp. CPCC 206217]|uniref:hypothetical protein n=1 Tax=Conexibacter sp. CPCC 206217 TaxID=3064574 RepID=UPI0027254565|nr:hypothetical protein [Conexibacter sp. CPCC 206217]MDO8214192.1 hypothetical protein [Conexibacter sp. CPCC 206217]